MFSKILVPLDDTPEAARAQPVAVAVARATGATVTLLRVVPAWSSPEDPELVGARTELARLAIALAGEGLGVDTTVVRVPHREAVAGEIMREATARGADLVVMATHARHGLARLTLGSVAEQVLARGDVPVVLLGPGARVWARLARLLAPVDGTPAGCAALDAAAALAGAVGAEVVLLRAVPPVPTGRADPLLGGTAAQGPELCYDEAELRDAQAYVDRLAEQFRGRGIAAEGRALHGPVGELILQVGEQLDADLIVMGTHALRGAARDVVGSVAATVVERSPRPVLLAPRCLDRGAWRWQGTRHRHAAHR